VDLRDPAATVTTQDHHALVAALMAPYYGSGSGETGRDLRAPAPTVTTRDRLQLVTVNLDGVPHVITDIGMRMLQPRELFRAQGFPDSYIIDPIVNGKPLTKTAQVRMCGNSVPPVWPAALVKANFAHEAAFRTEAAA
jgi:DNA (cytosine-5)-methyltransferase 1